jgi:urea transporter
MVLSNLAYGFLLSIVLGWSKPNGVFAGAITGGVVGLLIGISIDFSMYSMSNMFLNFSAVLVDIILYTLMSAIAGMFIALVFGAGRQKA